MRRTGAADTANTLSESEIAFVLRGAKRKSGPEMLRHVASANAGPQARAAKRKSAPAGKAKKTAKRRKA